MAALDLPLAFAPAQNGISLTAVLSLEKETNAHIGPQGDWMGGYKPLMVRFHPFFLALSGSKAQVLIDEDSDWISPQRGNPLFDKEGNPTELLNKYIQGLKQSVANP